MGYQLKINQLQTSQGLPRYYRDNSTSLEVRRKYMIFMCVCTSRQSSRCTHAPRETRQQLCILPRNQIYSAAASYFRPHCSRSLLIAIARQRLRAANSAVPKILQSSLQNCLPVTARRSWLHHYSTYCDDAMSNIVIEMTLYVCPLICSSRTKRRTAICCGNTATLLCSAWSGQDYIIKCT